MRKTDDTIHKGLSNALQFKVTHCKHILIEKLVSVTAIANTPVAFQLFHFLVIFTFLGGGGG